MSELLDDYLQRINESIYISGQLSPAQLNLLPHTAIQSFLCLRCTQESGFMADEKHQLEPSGIVYRHRPVSAETLSYEGIAQILKEIDELPQPILISCRSAFRAGFIALLYLATRNHLTHWETQTLKQHLGFDFSTKPTFQQWFERYLNQYSAG